MKGFALYIYLVSLAILFMGAFIATASTVNPEKYLISIVIALLANAIAVCHLITKGKW